MSETEIAPRLCKMAAWGLALCVTVYPVGFLAFLMVGPCHPPTDWRGTAGPLLGLLALASLAVGIVLCLVSIVRIARSSGTLWGIGIALIGIVFVGPILFMAAGSLR